MKLMRLKEKFQRLFKKRSNIDKYDNYYHESGHAIIAYMFPDVFDFNYVTLNKRFCLIHDPLSKGGLHGKPIKTVANLTLIDHDKLALISLAGLCADDINNLNGIFTKRYNKKKLWNEFSTNPRYQGDFMFFQSEFSYIKNLIKIDQETYVSISVKFLNAIMRNDIVWDTINSFRFALMNSIIRTLNITMINMIISQGKYNKWAHRNLGNIKKKRSKTIMQYILKKTVEL